MAAMKRAVRTVLRPPPIMLLPFHLPGLAGVRRQACETGDGLERSSVPSSGSSAISVYAVFGPIPGTEVSKSSFSRHAGEPRTVSSISRSSSASSFSKAPISRVSGSLSSHV